MNYSNVHYILNTDSDGFIVTTGGTAKLFKTNIS